MVGGVLLARTVSWKVVLVLAWPSLTVTVIVATPVCVGAGVTVRVRLMPLPPNARFVVGTSVGLDELPLTVRLAAAVSRSPMVKASGPAGAPTGVDWLAMLDTVGASLTAVTVSEKLVAAVNWPSLTVSVMVAAPFWLAAGVTVRVRLAPLPPSARLVFGTSVALEEVAVTTRLVTAVSASPTVKASGAIGVSSLIV